MGKIISISGLEGAGKSTFAANLAYALALRQQVSIIIPSQLNYGRIQLFYGDVIEDDKGIFSCFTDRTDHPEKFLTQCKMNPNIYILGVPNNNREPYENKIEEEKIAKLFMKLSVSADFLLVDCSPGLNNPINLQANSEASRIFELTQLTMYGSLRIRALGDTLNLLCDNVSYIISEHYQGCDVDDFLKQTGIRPVAFLPDVPRAVILENESRLIYNDKNRHSKKYKKTIDSIADSLLSDGWC